MQLEAANVVGGCRVRGTLEECRKSLAARDVAALCMGPQLACGHVLDHALTQRADGGIGTHGELLLSEVVDTSIFPQDGAPHPYDLLSSGYTALDRAPRAAAIAAAISCPGTSRRFAAEQKMVRCCDGFRMPAPSHELSTHNKVAGPAFESRQ